MPRAPGNQVPCSVLPNGAIIDLNNGEGGRTGHTTREYYRDRKIEAFSLRPTTVGADLGNSPDNAIHLVGQHASKCLVNIVDARLVKQIEEDRVSEFLGLLLNANLGAQRAKIVQPECHDANAVAAALDQAAHQSVGDITQLVNHFLDTLEGLWRDIGALVDDARDSLSRNTSCMGYLSDRHARSISHFGLLY